MPQRPASQNESKPIAALVTVVTVTGALVAAVLAGFVAGANSLRK